MRKLRLAAFAMALFTLGSCGSGSTNQPANAEGFKAIEADIKGEFGDEAYFTALSIMYDATIGNMINVTTTKDPASLKMGEWNFSQGKWTQSSEVTIEIPEGTEAADYMFQLNGDVSLSKLGDLVEESKKKLTKEKSIENPALSMAFVKFPDTGEFAKAQYVVNLEPATGGTTFSFYYKLDGEFIEMDY